MTEKTYRVGLPDGSSLTIRGHYVRDWGDRVVIGGPRGENVAVFYRPYVAGVGDTAAIVSERPGCECK